jgi:hypothetical protein
VEKSQIFRNSPEPARSYSNFTSESQSLELIRHFKAALVYTEDAKSIDFGEAYIKHSATM